MFAFTLQVVSTILYSMLFVSFLYCGNCYQQIELSNCVVIVVQKSSSGDRKFTIILESFYFLSLTHCVFVSYRNDILNLYIILCYYVLCVLTFNTSFQYLSFLSNIVIACL